MQGAAKKAALSQMMDPWLPFGFPRNGAGSPGLDVRDVQEVRLKLVAVFGSGSADKLHGEVVLP